MTPTLGENLLFAAGFIAWCVYVLWRLRPRDRQPFDRHTL